MKRGLLLEELGMFRWKVQLFWLILSVTVKKIYLLFHTYFKTFSGETQNLPLNSYTIANILMSVLIMLSLPSWSVFKLASESFYTTLVVWSLPCRSGLILFISCSTPGISYFSKDPCFLSVETIICISRVGE